MNDELLCFILQLTALISTVKQLIQSAIQLSYQWPFPKWMAIVFTIFRWDFFQESCFSIFINVTCKNLLTDLLFTIHQFVMYILTEQEEGLYNLYFHACPNYQRNLFPLNFEVIHYYYWAINTTNHLGLLLFYRSTSKRRTKIISSRRVKCLCRNYTLWCHWFSSYRVYSGCSY